MDADLSRVIAAAIEKRAADTDLPRRPDDNNPLRPAYQRPARRTGRTYRDPVGQQAVGKIDRERKKRNQ